MKKKYFKTTCVMLAASMILSFTGCEKKAATIDGLSEEEIEEETVVADTSNKQSSKDSNDNNGADEKIPDSYRWTETLYGGSEGFESVTMQVTLEDYSDKTMDAYTFEAEDFDKDYIHSMCDSLFDGGEAEVYDYHYKTKREYDDLIGYYETAYDLYTFCKENNMDVFSFYPKALFGMWGEWELQPAVEEFDGALIEQDINTLRSEMEQAPEKIENDYSYQGYLGKVNGEEYLVINVECETKNSVIISNDLWVVPDDTPVLHFKVTAVGRYKDVSGVDADNNFYPTMLPSGHIRTSGQRKAIRTPTALISCLT